MKLRFNVLLLLVAIFSLLVPSMPVVQANWYCGGWYNDCGSTYPDECCVTSDGNIIPMCVGITSDCIERCCTGGGCDTYDDFRFCNDGYNMNCDVRNDDSPYNLACCPDAYPNWNEEAQQCWKAGWECTNSYSGNCAFTEPYCINYQCVECISNSDCAEDAFCSDNRCLGVECADDGNICTDDVIVNHACQHKWRSGCCLSDANCAEDEKCNVADKACELLLCNDADICTTDTASNHLCSYPWEQGCCHDDDDCELSDYCDLSTSDCKPVVCDDNFYCRGEKEIFSSKVESHGCATFTTELCNETYYCSDGECVEIPFPWTSILFIAAIATIGTAAGGAILYAKTKRKKKIRWLR